MIKGILTMMVAVLVVVGTSWAGPKKHKDEGLHKISEVDFSSITLSIGEGGDTHETYKITRDTKVTINGATADASSLRAGMVAKVAAGSDKVATGIEAKDAPRNPARHRVG